MMNSIIHPTLAALGAIAPEPEATFWLPVQAAEQVAPVDSSFYFVYWVSVVSFAIIVGFAALFAWKYRRKHPDQPALSQHSHSNALEIAWTVPPIIVVVFMFLYGWQAYLDMRTPPEQAYAVQVTGQKWKWLFQYPNGWVDDKLHVPIGEPVQLILQSEDVLHSAFIPAFRVKMDAVPGRYTKLWFTATHAGEYDFYCTEYCGTDHSNMRTKVIVHPPGGFETYLEEAEEALLNLPPAELGASLYEKRGCNQCHSIDGSPGKAPTFKGLFGKTETFTSGGSAVVDENYLRESIIDPNALVVSGYNPVMPTFAGKLKDKEITGLIEYIKTLK